jgi:hypothetical protein
MVKAAEVQDITSMEEMMVGINISTTREMATTIMAIRVTTSTTLGGDMATTMEATMAITTTMTIVL